MNRRIDCELIAAAYKTVLYTADEGLHGRNVLQSVVNGCNAHINLSTLKNVAMSLYDIIDVL